jgi:hypothetical protein
LVWGGKDILGYHRSKEHNLGILLVSDTFVVIVPGLEYFHIGSLQTVSFIFLFFKFCFISFSLEISLYDGEEKSKDSHSYIPALLWQVRFFDFYGRKLNNWDVGISCNSSRTFFLKSDKE